MERITIQLQHLITHCKVKKTKKKTKKKLNDYFLLIIGLSTTMMVDSLIYNKNNIFKNNIKSKLHTVL